MDVDDVLGEDTEVMWFSLFHFHLSDLITPFLEVEISVNIIFSFFFRISLKLRVPTMRKTSRNLSLLSARCKFIVT